MSQGPHSPRPTLHRMAPNHPRPMLTLTHMHRHAHGHVHTYMHAPANGCRGSIGGS